MVVPSDDDVVAVVTKPKPRTNKTKPWDGVAPFFLEIACKDTVVEYQDILF